MKQRGTNPFAGLPKTLVDTILQSTCEIAEDVFKPFRDITDSRDSLRKQLLDGGALLSLNGDGDGDVPPSCGIDGYSRTGRILSSELFCSAAFAVEGLVPPSGEKHWDGPEHASFIQTGHFHSASANILGAVCAEMKAELAIRAPHEIVLLNGSFTGLLLKFMVNLLPALAIRESEIGREFLSRVKPSLAAFKTIFANGGTDRMWVDMGETGGSSECIAGLNLKETYDEPFFFTVILEPGEYTAPVPADGSVATRIGKIRIRDEKFSEVRNGLVEAASKRSVLYFRPHEWTAAFRVETSAAVLADPVRLGRLLACIRFQCGTPGVSVPYPVYSAEKMARSMKQAIPALQAGTASNLTYMHKDDLGGIFPLVMFRKNNETGESQ